MSKGKTIGQEIVENDLLDEVSDPAALDKIAALIDLAVASAFRTGFEHAVSGGDDAGRRFPQLTDVHALVLYFGSRADAQEFVDLIKDTMPGLTRHSIPERVKRA